MNNESYIKEIYQYIHDTPRLMSLLYDIDLLPEQTMDDQKYHNKTLMIAHAWRENNNRK